jgi:hypothetical protein
VPFSSMKASWPKGSVADVGTASRPRVCLLYPRNSPSRPPRLRHTQRFKRGCSDVQPNYSEAYQYVATSGFSSFLLLGESYDCDSAPNPSRATSHRLSHRGARNFPDAIWTSDTGDGLVFNERSRIFKDWPITLLFKIVLVTQTVYPHYDESYYAEGIIIFEKIGDVFRRYSAWKASQAISSIVSHTPAP